MSAPWHPRGAALRHGSVRRARPIGCRLRWLRRRQPRLRPCPSGWRTTRRPAPLGPLIAIAVIASLLGIAFGLLIDWFPTSASTQAKDIDTFYDVLIIASVPMFVLVVAVVLYCAMKFRMRPGQEDMDGPPIHGNTRLEVIWTIIPAVMMLALCTYAYVLLHDAEKAPANAGRRAQRDASSASSSRGRSSTKPRRRAASASRRRSCTSRRTAPSSSTSRPRTCCTTSGSPPSAGRSTRCPASRRSTASRPTASAAIRWSARSCAASATRRCARTRTSWSPRSSTSGSRTSAPAARRAAAARAAPRPVAPRAARTARPCSPRRAAAPATPSRTPARQGGVGPDLDETLAGKDAAFIEESIVDPNAEVEGGFPRGRHADQLPGHVVARGARRSGEVPGGDDQRMRTHR